MRAVNPTPWWYWALALAGVPFVALVVFVGLAVLFEWSETGVWVAAMVSGVGGIAAMVAVGQRLAIGRFRTWLGALLACLAAPAWGFGLVIALFSIYCPDGCFN